MLLQNLLQYLATRQLQCNFSVWSSEGGGICPAVRWVRKPANISAIGFSCFMSPARLFMRHRVPTILQHCLPALPYVSTIRCPFVCLWSVGFSRSPRWSVETSLLRTHCWALWLSMHLPASWIVPTTEGSLWYVLSVYNGRGRCSSAYFSDQM
jgi:hypothetical protein